MTDVELYQWTLFLAFMLLVIEMLSGTFIFLGFAIGLLPLVFIHYFTEEVNWGRDLAIFSIVSAIALFMSRKFFRKHGDTKVQEQDINNY